jgi:hypothetical protein
VFYQQNNKAYFCQLPPLYTFEYDYPVASNCPAALSGPLLYFNPGLMPNRIRLTIAGLPAF